MFSGASRLRPLWLAVQFLTPVPTPVQINVSAHDWGRATLAYPLVGLGLGLLVAVFHLLLGDTDPGVQAAFLLTLWTFMTGGLHIRGLADSADAWAGGAGDRQRSLEIIRDPRSGTAAIVAVVLSLLIKFAALAALVAEGHWQVLLFVPMLGRAAMIALLLTTPYLQANDGGYAYATHLPRTAATWVLVAVGATVMVMMGWGGSSLLLLAALLVWGVRLMILRRLGGTTEQTLRAICEIVETGMLMLVVLIWGGG